MSDHATVNQDRLERPIQLSLPLDNLIRHRRMPNPYDQNDVDMMITVLSLHDFFIVCQIAF